MHAWEAIQKTLDYIERQISEDIHIVDLAKTARLSLFYYQRLFARLVKRPVFEYIKLRRLAHASEHLRDKGKRILDVALDLNFGSHEAFTRAFKEAYGITPAMYRDKCISLNHFAKPDLLLNYVMVDEGVPLISNGLVLEMNRKVLTESISFIGVKGYFPFRYGKMLGERTEVSIPGRVWNELDKSIYEIQSIPNGRRIGVCYRGDAPEGHTTYFAGVEVDSDAEDSRYPVWTLPAREYVVCGFEAEDTKQLMETALGKAMKFTRSWLKGHGLIADSFFPELYYQNLLDEPYMELWIPFRVREDSGKEVTNK